MFPSGSYPYGAAQAAAAAAAAAQYAAGGHQLPNAATLGSSAAAAAPAGAAAGVIHQHATDESMREFWQAQMIEVQGVGTNTEDFKNHQLPLARIKKVRDIVFFSFFSFRRFLVLILFLFFAHSSRSLSSHPLLSKNIASRRS